MMYDSSNPTDEPVRLLAVSSKSISRCCRLPLSGESHGWRLAIPNVRCLEGLGDNGHPSLASTYLPRVASDVTNSAHSVRHAAGQPLIALAGTSSRTDAARSDHAAPSWMVTPGPTIDGCADPYVGCQS